MTRAYLSAVTFVTLVVASNWLTARFGLVAGFVTAGTFTAGLSLAARDALRETTGRAWRTWVMACIAAGAGISALMTFWAGSFPGGPSPLRLAVASGVAFALSELADTAVYEPLRRRGRVRALAWSNVVGSVVDSLLFLTMAGFPIWPAVLGQVAVKWAVCVVLPLLIVGVVRVSVLRDRVRAEGA